MVGFLRIGALSLLVSVVAAIQVSAGTIMDPIVRTRSGAGGSIPIPPNNPFNWGTFPGLPPGFDPPDCDTGFEGPDLLPLVTCEFVNETGQPINFLGFSFDYTDATEPVPPLSEFDIQDGNNPENAIGWDTLNINQSGAQFIGSGIPAFDCPFEGECIPFHFFVDLVGFPDGTHVTMTALAEPVPEPMTLTLLATGLALGAGARHRRRK